VELWRHNGLNFASPFAVGVPAPNGAADVTVRVVGALPLGLTATGPVVAEMRLPSGAIYTVYEAGNGYLLRFHGLAQFWVSGDTSEVLCEPGDESTEGYLGVLLVGTITALLLTLRGYAVLHASAVSWHGRAVVFAGVSGRGKTTAAALACAAGGEFLCDDVVALTRADGAVAIYGLGYELRLREAAAGIIDLFDPSPPCRRTADDRLAVQPRRATEELNAIAAVVLPRPQRGSDRLTTRRLGPQSAVTHLLASARVPNMVPLRLQRPYFELVADLAAGVPVVEADLPWGPPFEASFIAELVDGVVASAHR